MDRRHRVLARAHRFRGWLAALAVPLALLPGCSAEEPSERDYDVVPSEPKGHPKRGDTLEKLPSTGPKTPSKPDYLLLANETHDFVVASLLTPSGSYKTTPHENRTDQWHNISQIGADVAMLATGGARYQPYVDATFAFMNHLWDASGPLGGYYATCAPDGSGVGTPTKFIDDNSLAGVTYLDAYAAATDPARKAAYLAAARDVANFLMKSGVWDTTYDGGFYWNTDKPHKPTQSNGLALQLFVRLTKITGETYYASWATSVEGWLDTKMFDARDGLYAWQWEAAGRNDAKFTYDQAILIDAQLDLYATSQDVKHLDRARSVANAMHAVLWDPTHGGYVISTQDRRLSPVFSAWASYTLVRLFDVDPNPVWLDRAAKNLAVLDAGLRDPVTHGYYSTSNPDGTNRSNVMQAVDQSWMQRAQAKMAGH